MDFDPPQHGHDMLDGLDRSNGPYFVSRPGPVRQDTLSTPSIWDEYAQGQSLSYAPGTRGLQVEATEENILSNSESDGGSDNDSDGELISEAESGGETGDSEDDDQTHMAQGAEQSTPRGGAGGEGGLRGRARRRPQTRTRGTGRNLAGRSVLALHNEAKRARKTGGNKRKGPRGHRKPLDPSPEFKKLHGQAMTAFIEGKYDLAEDFISQAILENPEIFTAHSLLSEIHMAQGDKQRALTALFHGAHTRPRDTQTWTKVAELMLDLAGEDRVSVLEDAVYCYNRVLGADLNNIDARYRRAALNFEAGKTSRAAYDYLKLLKILPNDLTVLRHLAEARIASNESAQAIRYYDMAIDYYKEQEPYDVVTFSWSDANIYAELFLFSNKYDEGLAKVKHVSRWLLGRAQETYWDAYQDDDREFDEDDHPRRLDVPEFEQYKYPVEAYGESLPMELRVKLGIFRLKLGEDHFEEAMRHFLWLEPENIGEDGRLHDYPDLFRETADVLSVNGHHQQALSFYEPIQNIDEYADTEYWKAMALCYRHLQRWEKAEFCYQTMRDLHGPDYVQADMELAAMFLDAGLPERARPYHEQIEEKRRSRKKPGNAHVRRYTSRNTDPDVPVNSIELNDSNVLDDAPGGLFHQAVRKREKEYRQKREEVEIIQLDLWPLFEQMHNLLTACREGEPVARTKWMSNAKLAIDHFGNERLFFPYDRQTKFLGFSKKARTKALRPRRKQMEMSQRAAAEGRIFDSDDDEEAPTTFCNVSFSDWFSCFMEYALLLAKEGDSKASYAICRLADGVNVFYHDEDRLFTIHLIWSMCAVIAQDHETLCTVTRYFIKENHFVTDSYRLFSALNRICNHKNVWYNNGPTQKFILRQVKAIDYSFISDEARKLSLYNERAIFGGKDGDGQFVKAEEMDIVLLMMYGHMLYYGESFVYSMHYFYRALALDPENPMVNLSLGLAYVHYALRRQAENRQYLIVQGLSFLFKYYDRRKQSEDPAKRQEAEYNIGRTFHMLGLLHLTIPYYERCLELSPIIQDGAAGSDKKDDVAKEVAYALRSIYAIDGAVQSAREITEKWLVL